MPVRFWLGKPRTDQVGRPCLPRAFAPQVVRMVDSYDTFTYGAAWEKSTAGFEAKKRVTPKRTTWKRGESETGELQTDQREAMTLQKRFVGAGDQIL